MLKVIYKRIRIVTTLTALAVRVVTLEKIGCFDREIGEIVDKTGMERTKVMKYISELADYYGIIEKVENKLGVSKRGIRY